MAKVLLYLGEMDSISDLIDRVGEERAYKAWHGKLYYFNNLSDGSIFGVNNYEADRIFNKFGCIETQDLGDPVKSLLNLFRDNNILFYEGE